MIKFDSTYNPTGHLIYAKIGLLHQPIIESDDGFIPLTPRHTIRDGMTGAVIYSPSDYFTKALARGIDLVELRRNDAALSVVRFDY